MQSLAKGKIHWLFTQTIEIKAFEKGQKEFTIIYFPNVDILMIKGKQFVVTYFPNVDILMIKGKHFFVIFQVLASNLGFMC